jgi:hypothetical protein
MYATDGIVGVYARVDVQNLPDVLVPAEDLVHVARDSAVSGLWDEPQRIIIQTVSGTHVLRKADPAQFPPLPPVPSSLQPLEEWPTIQKVVHAAGEVPGRPELDCVHFHRDRVEATDSFRVAMADVLTPIETMVPASTFRHWPKSEPVWAAVENGWAYFRVGNELRAVVAVNAKAPDCRQYLAAEHVGNYMVVDSKTFLEAVKKASKVDAIVRLKFGVMSLHVCGRSSESEKQFYADVHGEDYTKLEGTRGLTAGQTGIYPDLNLDGPKLIDALKAVDTPNVRLCYQDDETKPLRIESGGYSEALWTVLE